MNPRGGLTPPTRLAGERLRPLGHLSIGSDNRRSVRVTAGPAQAGCPLSEFPLPRLEILPIHPKWKIVTRPPSRRTGGKPSVERESAARLRDAAKSLRSTRSAGGTRTVAKMSAEPHRIAATPEPQRRAEPSDDPVAGRIRKIHRCRLLLMPAMTSHRWKRPG